MSALVSLDDVVDHVDLSSPESNAYLNRRTGEIVLVTDEEARLVESDTDPENLPDWQAEALPKVREALTSEEYLILPGKDDFDEYGLMERFSREVEDAEVSAELLRAIQGRGAFRRFKDLAGERSLLDEWYTIRQRALEDYAAQWLEENGIAFTREPRGREDEERGLAEGLR